MQKECEAVKVRDGDREIEEGRRRFMTFRWTRSWINERSRLCPTAGGNRGNEFNDVEGCGDKLFPGREEGSRWGTTAITQTQESEREVKNSERKVIRWL